MDATIAQISALKAAEIPPKVSVKLQVGASKQLEAVAKEIFDGIAQTPQPGKGTKINIVT